VCISNAEIPTARRIQAAERDAFSFGAGLGPLQLWLYPTPERADQLNDPTKPNGENQMTDRNDAYLRGLKKISADLTEHGPVPYEPPTGPTIPAALQEAVATEIKNGERLAELGFTQDDFGQWRATDCRVTLLFRIW
jgi:hypothetical protein